VKAQSGSIVVDPMVPLLLPDQFAVLYGDANVPPVGVPLTTPFEKDNPAGSVPVEDHV
jgi:hypothetical protein